MHIRVLAVGGRQPGWVNDAFDDYAGRLPRQWRFELKVLPAGARGKNHSIDNAVRAEGQSILDQLRRSERVVVLDERGEQYSSVTLAEKLDAWQHRDEVYPG